MPKNLIFFITILLINTILFRCQHSKNNETILSGSIVGYEADSLEITHYRNYHWESKESLWIPVDSVGKFTTTLPVHSLKEFRTKQSRVLMKPGWETTIHIYMNKEGEMDSTTFEGDGAAESKVFNKMDTLIMIYDLYDQVHKEPEEFIAFLDSTHLVMTTYVDSLKDPDKEVERMLRNNIAYHKMGRWEWYAEQKFDRAGKDRPDSIKEYSSQFDNLVVFDNTELLNSFMYTGILDDYFRELLRDRIDFDALLAANQGNRKKAREEYNIATFNLTLDLADSIIPNNEIKSYIYLDAFYKAFLYDVSPQLIESLEQNIAGRLQNVVTDTTSINHIAHKIDRIKSLSPGKSAPNFSFPDVNGNLVSLMDLKGKYLYIDIWATWCGPCIREFPKLKELEEEFGDEIAFMSISVDNDNEKWRNYVREKELSGIQIHSQGGGKAEIMDLYMIQAIPRFIMIDPVGKIINVDASRPSHEITRKIFQRWIGLDAVDIESI